MTTIHQTEIPNTEKKTEQKKPILPTTWLEWGHFFLVILAIMGMGILIVNQTTNFWYHEKLLQTPCSLCAELNPQFNACFGNLSQQYRGHEQDIKFQANLSSLFNNSK